MTDGISMEVGDLLKLVSQLGRVSDELPKGILPAAEGAAYTTKEAWRASLNDSDVPAAGSTIQYEVTGSGDSASAVIASTEGTARLQGYVYAREYGSLTVAPGADAAHASEIGAADFERGLGIAGQRAILRAFRN